MKLCNYCHKPVPQGYGLWWNQKPYHPDCAIQVAVTEINRNAANNKNTERREFEMNCRYCDQHILATMSVVWKGYHYHEQCLAKAIQEFYEPPREEFNQHAEFAGDFDPEEFYEDEDYDDNDLAQAFEAGELEANGVAVVDPTRESTVVVAPQAMIHPPEGNGQMAIAPDSKLMVHCWAKRINRADLSNLPIPDETATFKPVPHGQLVEIIEEALAFRHIRIAGEEYAASADGMKLFGVLRVNADYEGVGFAIGLRNSNDKSMRLGIVSGYKVFCCDNLAFSGDFNPLLAKHSKNLDLIESVSIAVDRIQRQWQPLRTAIDFKRQHELSSESARSLLYKLFTDYKFPVSLFRTVHKEFFVHPSYPEFSPRTLWSLENSVTTSIKRLAPMAQYQQTARFGRFISDYLKSVN